MTERDLTIVQCPRDIKLIAIINAIGALLTIVFWTLAFTRLPSPASIMDLPERANMATTFGFGLADIVWSLPLLLLAAVGVWKMSFRGWLAAQMTNVLWWYSLSVISTRDFYTRTLSPGTVIFMPFALFAFWAAWMLWKERELFWDAKRPR